MSTRDFLKFETPLTTTDRLTCTCSPPDTLYEGGFLRSRLSFPQDFPLNPPKMKFITEMWHPNGKQIVHTLHFRLRVGLLTMGLVRTVYKNGEVCISILHPPGVDQYGFEDAGERWMPVHTVESIVSMIGSFFLARRAQDCSANPRAPVPATPPAPSRPPS